MTEKAETGLGLIDILEDARGTLLKIVLAIFSFSILAYLVSGKILIFLLRLVGLKPVSYAPQEALLTILKLSLYSGVVFSFPVVSILAFRFIMKKIDPESSWIVPIFVLISLLLFLAGAALCYFLLLPAGIKFLLSFGGDYLNPGISVGKYVDFCSFFLIATGLAFQAPLIAFVLARAGLLTPEYFKGKSKYAVLACFIIAALVTPTPDIYNMMLMALPLLVIYFLSLLVVRMASKN